MWMAASAMAGEWNSSSQCADEFHWTYWKEGKELKEWGRMMRGDGFYQLYRSYRFSQNLVVLMTFYLFVD